MAAVLISGTFAKDERPNNGLEAIADELAKDELTPHVIVGIVVPHAYAPRKVGQPLVPVVRFVAIEVVDDSVDAVTVRELLDAYRAKRKREPVEASLFDADGWARDTDADE